MLKRTTHYLFQPYGEILYSLPEGVNQASSLSTGTFTVDSKTFNRAHCSSDPVYISCESGIVLLALSMDGEHFEQFVIHRIVKLKPNVYFNMVSISGTSRVCLHVQGQNLKEISLKKPFHYDPVISRLQVREILTNFYQVRKGNYVFPGESHDYFELVYIDQGVLHTQVDNQEYTLNKYDLMLYFPGQFHSQYTKSTEKCSYLTITFRMEDGIDMSLKNRVFHTRKDIYRVLCRFMQSIQHDAYLNYELSILHLKEVMILLHQFDHKEAEKTESNPMQQNYENTLLNEILVYINNNITHPLSVEDLCTKFSISRSSLQNLFRSNLKISPKQYISNVKLNQAKVLIQEHNQTISDISDELGFSSIHYFSRKFKAQFGMSPTDYSRSIFR